MDGSNWLGWRLSKKPTQQVVDSTGGRENAETNLGAAGRTACATTDGKFLSPGLPMLICDPFFFRLRIRNGRPLGGCASGSIGP